MTEKASCPNCGNELPFGAPAGVCPRCLLEAGLSTQVPDAMSSANQVALAPPDSSDAQSLPPKVRDDVAATAAHPSEPASLGERAISNTTVKYRCSSRFRNDHPQMS